MESSRRTITRTEPADTRINKTFLQGLHSISIAILTFFQQSNKFANFYYYNIN